MKTLFLALGAVLFLFQPGFSQSFLRPDVKFNSLSKMNSLEKDIQTVFYHSSFGGCVVALGEGPMLDYNTLSDVGLGLYYSPQIGFRLGYMHSITVGFNVQAMLNESSGFILSHPLTLGFNCGSGANKENEEDLGYFLHFGFGPSFIANTDPNYDMNLILGPYGDLGIRFREYELKISATKSVKTINEGYLITGGLGKVF